METLTHPCRRLCRPQFQPSATASRRYHTLTSPSISSIVPPATPAGAGLRRPQPPLAATACCCRHPHHPHYCHHQTPPPSTACSHLPPSAVGENIRRRWWRSNAFDGRGNGQRQGNGKATAAKMDLNGGQWAAGSDGGWRRLMATMDDSEAAVVEN